MALLTCSPQATGQGDCVLSGYPLTSMGLGVEMTRLVWPQITPGKLAPRASMSDIFPLLLTPPHRGKKRLSQHTPSAEEGLSKTPLKEGKLPPLLWTLPGSCCVCAHLCLCVCAHLCLCACVFREVQSPPAQTHPQVLRSSEGSKVEDRVLVP